jgi:hypothetical protein
MTTTINAFHPAYVATHMPEFMTKMRNESTQAENGRMYAARSKVQRVSVADKSVSTIRAFPKTKRVSLAPLEITYYSKAGTANTTKKKKK